MPPSSRSFRNTIRSFKERLTDTRAGDSFNSNMFATVATVRKDKELKVIAAKVNLQAGLENQIGNLVFD
jgi:hypothetical protein